jgi:hypothetical protein
MVSDSTPFVALEVENVQININFTLGGNILPTMNALMIRTDFGGMDGGVTPESIAP